MASRARSSELFAQARRLMPGGVSSPVRAFHAVGAEPFYSVRGRGSRLFDVDGNEYIDHVCSWGPLILGHAHPEVVAAVAAAAARGLTFGTCAEGEVELARLVRERMPAVERLRLVSSGTEAAMSALRVARAATGRAGVVKMDGGYHGHADAMLVGAGSGGLTFGIPSSAGVTPGAVADTLVVPHNDLEAVARALEGRPGGIAAVIVEPVAANMGVVAPAAGYLAGLRRLTSDHGALLVFDEVVTGFRVHAGGAQGRFGVTPDLTVLGKILGGGLPLAAYGGREELMALVAPEGPVYQAGTLSGNPVAVAAGTATLRALTPAVYDHLEATAGRLCGGLQAAAQRAGVPVQINRVGSMWTPFFIDRPVVDAGGARAASAAAYGRFFRACLAGGVFIPPSPFEACFLSTAHGDEAIEKTLEVMERALGEHRGDRWPSPPPRILTPERALADLSQPPGT